MPTRSRSLRAVGVLFLLGLAACASGGAGETTGRAGTTAVGEPVAITDVKSVAGRWAGLMDLPGGGRDIEYLEVTVREDGTYQATSARTIGVMDARGTIVPRDGRLVIQGASGARGTATLYSRQGQPTLMVDVTAANQSRTTARLQPQR
jgi:hypothetical protein